MHINFLILSLNVIFERDEIKHYFMTVLINVIQAALFF